MTPYVFIQQALPISFTEEVYTSSPEVIVFTMMMLFLGVFIVPPFSLKWGAKIVGVHDLSYWRCLKVTFLSGLATILIGGSGMFIPGINFNFLYVVQLFVYIMVLYFLTKKYGPSLKQFLSMLFLMALFGILFGGIIGLVFTFMLDSNFLELHLQMKETESDAMKAWRNQFNAY